MQDRLPQGELREIVAAVRALVERQQQVGTRGFPFGAARNQPSRNSDVRNEKSTKTPPPGPPATPRSEDLFADPGVRESTSLAELRNHIGDCQRCKLAGGRTNIVFGVGNANAELMFVGEGPGYDEDIKAEPFVGRAGQLLTEIITKGMKLRREDVYIANVVKCRPPGNRNPEPDEIASCMPFLRRQIALVQPRVIVALGTFAAQTLLAVRTPIMRMRGVWHEYEGIKVMPTLHPAYLLRTPADKRLVWNDIKLVMNELGMG